MKEFIASIGKLIILKIIYPRQYYKWSREPIVKGKVIVLEVRSRKISNSLRLISNRLENEKHYNVNYHFLLEAMESRLETFKRTLLLLKDMATAEYVFLDEACHAFACLKKRNETKVIQVWHGCGAFKKFGLSTSNLKFGSNRPQQQKYPLYSNLDLVTVSSPEVIWAYEEAMGLKEGIVRATGISRTDVFFDKEYLDKARQKIYKLVPNAKGKKIILYAPTFRGSVENAKAPDRLDINAMRQVLDSEYILLIKHHPFVRIRPEIPISCVDFAFDVSEAANIDDLICTSDMCISDYSSLVFEYALFNRPIIFFAYDINEYKDWRGFYYDYEELTPGPVVNSTEEILTYIEKIEAAFDESKINEFSRKYMSSCDGSATDRIFEYVGIK